MARTRLVRGTLYYFWNYDQFLRRDLLDQPIFPTFMNELARRTRNLAPLDLSRDLRCFCIHVALKRPSRGVTGFRCLIFVSARCSITIL